MGGPPIDFVSTRDIQGPRGGRMVIDEMFVVIEGVITVATAAVDARDMSAFIDQLTVEQNDGEQRNAPLSGVQHQLVTIQQVGPESYPLPGGISIGAAQTVNARIPIVYEQTAFQERGYDWCLGVELLRKVQVKPNSLVGAAKGTTVLSAPTLTCYVEFWGHEELYLEAKCLDEYSVIAFTSLTQVAPSLSGPLMGAWLISTNAPAASSAGGGALVTVTDFRIDALGIPLTPRAAIVALHRLLRHRGNMSAVAVGGEVYADPITEQRMLEMLPPQTSIQAPWDGYTRGPMSLRFDVTPGQANLEVLVRTAKKRSVKSWELSCKAFGIDPNAGGSKITTANGKPMVIDERSMYAPWRIEIPGLA